MVQGLTVPVGDLDHTTITVRGHITIMEVRATPPPPPPRRRYYGGRTTYVYSNGSSGGAFVTIIMLMLVLIVFFDMQFKGGYTGAHMSDNRISEYAEDQYNTVFQRSRGRTAPGRR